MLEGRFTERILTTETLSEQKHVINISEHDSADCANPPTRKRHRGALSK